MTLTGVPGPELAFIGDDLPDIDAMRLVGLACAVADAEDEVRSAAHYVTQRNGGHGAVRELIDLLLNDAQRMSYPSPPASFSFSSQSFMCL